MTLFEVDDAQSERSGAIPCHIVINCPREEAIYNLWMDYFTEVPRFGKDKFRRRFRMNKSLFHRITDVVKDHDNFFYATTTIRNWSFGDTYLSHFFGL